MISLYETIKKQAWGVVRHYKSRVDIDELINETYIQLHDKNPTDKKIRSLLISLTRKEKQTIKAATSWSLHPTTNSTSKNTKTYSDKQCNACKEYLPVSEFAHYIQKNGHTKIYHLCIGCQKEQNRSNYIKNKQIHDIGSKEWRLKHPGEYRKIKERYYLKKKKMGEFKDRNIPVAEINSDGIVVNIYPSLAKAAMSVGANRAESLSIAIKNNRPYHGRLFKTKIA